MRRSNGFTLIEMVVAICVVGIMFFASIPVFSNMVSIFELKAVARDIVSDLRFSQEKATGGRCSVLIEFAPRSLFGDPAVYYIRKTGASGKSETVRSVRLSAKFDFTKKAILRFASTGFPPPGGSGTVVVEDRGGRTRSIILSSAGRVRME